MRRGLWVLVLLGLLMVFPRVVVGDEVECTEAEKTMEVKDAPEKSRTVILIILTSLIICTLLFETTKDKLEELAEGPMQPILDSMWGELTVLGFLGLLTFIIQRLEFLAHLSCHIFGDSSTIPEDLEAVHMMLFLVMVMFLAQVVMLVFLGKRLGTKWKILEEAVREPDAEAEIFERWFAHSQERSSWDLGLYMYSTKATTREKMEYLLLRRQFIKQHDKCDDDFDFAEYLSLVLGEELGEIVEVKLTTWCIMELLFVGFYFYFALSNLAIIIGVIVASVLLFLVLLLTKRKLNVIHSMLTPNPPRNISNQDLEADNTPLLFLERTQPRFIHRPLKQRGWLGRLLLGEPPNKHELLFWFDRHGPAFLFALIQFSLLFCSLYVAIFSLNLSKLIVQLDKPAGVKAVLFIVGYLPILLSLGWLIPIVVGRYVEVCNIELLKKDAAVKEVTRAIKTQKALRAMRMLHVVAFTQYLADSRGAAAAPSPETALLPGTVTAINDSTTQRILSETLASTTFDDTKIQEMREMFVLYDEDQSGHLDKGELAKLMKKLGTPIDEPILLAMINAVDTDGNEELDVDEFVELLKGWEAVRNLAPEDSVVLLFKMLDEDASGTISLDELGGALNQMGDAFTLGEIEELLRDIDENGDGEIDMGEFQELMEKYHVIGE